MLATMTKQLTALRLPHVTPRDALRILVAMSDPRGRCNRKAMTIITTAFILAQLVSYALANLIGGETGRMVFWAINLPILLIGCSVLVKRLHDINLTGLLAPAAIILWAFVGFATAFTLMILWPERMALADGEKNLFYWVVLALIALPAFGGFVWLHSAPGTPGSNLYGPAPDESGFAPNHRSRDIPAHGVATA